MRKIEFLRHVLVITIYILCFFLFFFTMDDVWTKFNSQLTTTASRFRGQGNDKKKQLPCVTMHALSAFKTQGVNFTNILHAHFCTKVFWVAFICLEFDFEQTFVQKMRTQNIDEIDPRCKFHQHFVSCFCVWKRVNFWQLFCTYVVCLKFFVQGNCLKNVGEIDYGY